MNLQYKVKLDRKTLRLQQNTTILQHFVSKTEQDQCLNEIRLRSSRFAATHLDIALLILLRVYLTV